MLLDSITIEPLIEGLIHLPIAVVPTFGSTIEPLIGGLILSLLWVCFDPFLDPIEPLIGGLIP